MYAEDDLLPLSGLQHLSFCERRWALVQIEGLWEENRFTAEGRVLHEKAHSTEIESRPGMLIRRTLPLRSFRLGISGQADIVEFQPTTNASTGAKVTGRKGYWKPFPIEYKRRKDRAGSLAYTVQLCAQAICLEEMLAVPVPEGAVFDGTTRRRTAVEFTSELRTEVERGCARMHELFLKRITPPPIFSTVCEKVFDGACVRAAECLAMAIGCAISGTSAREIEGKRWWFVMKPLLNTLYITQQGSWLSREGETVAVKQDDIVKARIPIHTLQGVVCFGQVSGSSFFMGLCAEHGVGVSFLTENGRFLARVQGPISGNVLLRKQQYRASDSPDSTRAIAAAIVMAKVANSRTVLLRAAREREASEEREALERSGLRLLRILSDVEKAATVDEVRGYEGDAARTYFSVFDYLIVAGKDEFSFERRSRRPPLDNVNALLSFLYTLLTHDLASALECVGLDPAVGFLHRDRPGRPSLAPDLVEELRPVIADRLALSMMNRRQLTGADFRKTETGGVALTDSARKAVLVAWQKRKQEEVVHPFVEERISLGLFPHVQAMLLARHLRGDLDAYPALVWK